MEKATPPLGSWVKTSDPLQLLKMAQTPTMLPVMQVAATSTRMSTRTKAKRSKTGLDTGPGANAS